MHIPVRPDYRDEWDQYTGVRSPYPTAHASLVRVRRLAFEELRRQEAAQRAQERRPGALVRCGCVPRRRGCCGDGGAPMSARQWWLHRAVTHIMLASLLTLWGLAGFGVYRWVRS